MRKQIVSLSIVTSLMLVGCSSDGYNAFPDQPHSVAEMVGKEQVVGWENYKDDSDGDKVPDYKDKCPNTPQGVEVDENGCVLDIDNDGIPDYKDKCPNTKPNMEVDKNGCYIDTDKDGVADYKDKCPDTPANIEVDNYGCAIDMDKDGVADYKDKCLSTPQGAEVDENGCALDSDKDGIPDGLDKCANTPKNAPIDKKGCALDSDNDGVIDLFDKCPDTLKELEVDVDGCPVDSDNDGVPNYKDKCPNTPSDVKVDFKGCPVIAEYRFHFNTNSFAIAPKYYKQIEKLVKVQEIETKTASGIYIPDNATQEKPTQAEIIAIGSDVKDVKVGDQVVFTKFARSATVTFEDIDYLVMETEEILGIMGGKR